MVEHLVYYSDEYNLGNYFKQTKVFETKDYEQFSENSLSL